MANYLNAETEKGYIIIHDSATPSNIDILTEENASTFNDSYALKFSPFQNGGLQYDYDSLATEDSGRTVDGQMHITWILTRARKLEIKIPPCSFAFYSRIVKRVMGKKYYITYIDPLTNAERTINVYTSNGRAGLYSGIVKNGLITGAQFNAIEMKGETS